MVVPRRVVRARGSGRDGRGSPDWCGRAFAVVSEQPERWIDVPDWDEFQHYRDRDPVWIKTYVRRVRHDDYLDLTLQARGLLHGIWLLRAQTGGPLRESGIKRMLHGGAVGRASGNSRRHIGRHLESLNRAGFIELLDSDPLAPETESEKEKEPAVRLEDSPKKESFGNLSDHVSQLHPETLAAMANGYGLEGALIDLLRKLRDKDEGTKGVIHALVFRNKLGEGAVGSAIEAATAPEVRSPTRAAVAELKRQAALKGRPA